MIVKISWKKSFTLIEMLIVIVIIGILAAALIPRLQSVQGRARDSKRKIDLRSIYNASEIYFLDNGKYPPLVGIDNYFSTGGSNRIPTLSGVLSPIPVDPINNGQYHVTGNYIYRYGNVFSGSTINTYDLTTKLENPNDPENCKNIHWTYRYPLYECVWAGTSFNFTYFMQYLYEYSPHSGWF